MSVFVKSQFVSPSMGLAPNSVPLSHVFLKRQHFKSGRTQILLTKADIFCKYFFFFQIKKPFYIKASFFLRHGEKFDCENGCCHYDGNTAVKSAFKIQLLASRSMGQTRNIFPSPCVTFSSTIRHVSCGAI